MDKYQQHELLGQGNNSVYRATRLSDGVDVALKRVKGWAGLEAADQEVALREVAVLKTLDHPHAITLLDSFSDGGDLCLVLPLVRPGAFVFESSVLPLTPTAVTRVSFQLASALAYLHGLQPQLLHRDIKPANLLLALAPGAALPPSGSLTPAQASALIDAGSVLLSDFGSALAMRRTLASGTDTGTSPYKASEILRLDEYAAPADMWSYGVTLLQLATGHLVGGTTAALKALMGLGGTPWTLQQALEGVYHDKFVKAGEEEAWRAACAVHRKAWEGLGAPLQHLIESCLVVEAEGRATAAELVQHSLFEKGRRVECLASAVAKLEVGRASVGSSGVSLVGGGGYVLGRRRSRGFLPHDQLLAVVEAGEGVELIVLQRACEMAVEAANGAGEAWVGRMCAALLAVVTGADLDKVVAAITALHGLQGVQSASSAVEDGAQEVLSAASRLGANNERLSRMIAEKEEDIARKEAEIATLTQKIAQLKAECALAAKVAALVAALKAHPSVAIAVEQACVALLSIAADPAGQEACVAAGAVPALVAALNAYPIEAAVAEKACAALSKIAAIPPGQEACVAANTVPAVVAAFNAHFKTASVAEKACGVLCDLSTISTGQEACVAGNAVPVLVNALLLHPEVALVAEKACWALLNISDSSACKEACMTTDTVIAVVKVLFVHLSNAVVAEKVCGVLCNINSLPAGQGACTAAEIVPFAIVAALKDHLNMLAVAEKACAAMCNIAVCSRWQRGLCGSRCSACSSGCTSSPS